MKQEPTPVLFLDIDGVLNYEGMPGWPGPAEWKAAERRSYPDAFLEMMLEPGRLALLASIMARVPRAGIVVHSSWRKGDRGKRVIPLLSRLSGIPRERFLGLAPWKLSSDRVHEIMMWVERNDPGGEGVYAVLDDQIITFPDGVGSGEGRGPGREAADTLWRRVGLQRSLVTTSPSVGLTPEKAEEVVRLLSLSRPRSQ